MLLDLLCHWDLSLIVQAFLHFVIYSTAVSVCFLSLAVTLQIFNLLINAIQESLQLRVIILLIVPSRFDSRHVTGDGLERTATAEPAVVFV